MGGGEGFLVCGLLQEQGQMWGTVVLIFLFFTMLFHHLLKSSMSSCIQVLHIVPIVLPFRELNIRPLKLDFVFSVTRPRYENCAAFDNQK